MWDKDGNGVAPVIWFGGIGSRCPIPPNQPLPRHAVTSIGIFMLTQSRLKELLHYDPDIGVFTWLVAACGGGSAGDVAGSPNVKGHLSVSIDGKSYRSHRLAWLYMTGGFPVDRLVRVNGVKIDNRFSNLREAANA